MNLWLTLIPGPGMILIACAAVIYWRRASGVPYRWFWVGAGLWTVAVALKVAWSLLIGVKILGFLKASLPYWAMVLTASAYGGIESSAWEMGLTLLAVLLWRQLGRDARRAIGIGIGAGAFEAFLLGLISLGIGIAVTAGRPGTETISKDFGAVAATTPLWYLAAPVERIIAILCHASTRTLVLLGVAKRRPSLVLYGFLIFTLLDGIATAAHVSNAVIGQISMWWIEAAISPLALISIPVLRWCYSRWGKDASEENPDQPEAAAS
jgi:uncharacterized membrane protein YhfC